MRAGPSFAPVVRPVDELTVEDLEAASVVVLNDVGPPSGELGTALTRFVEGGGGLWIVLGENARWPGGDFELLPGAAGEPADRDGRGGVLGFVDYTHPVFELFGTPRSGDLTTPRFFRYRPLDVQADAASARALRQRGRRPRRALPRGGPGAGVDVDRRQLLERPRAETHLPAARPPGRRVPRRVPASDSRG